MTEQAPDVRWASGPQFAEVAEALRVDTHQIIGVMAKDGDFHMVLYTPQPCSDWLPGMPSPEVFRAILRRGEDGILYEPTAAIPMPGYWDQVLEQIERSGE